MSHVTAYVTRRLLSGLCTQRCLFCQSPPSCVCFHIQAVKSEPGAGNGVITSYTVFNLASSANVTKDHDSIIYDDPELLAEVHQCHIVTETGITTTQTI